MIFCFCFVSIRLGFFVGLTHSIVQMHRGLHENKKKNMKWKVNCHVWLSVCRFAMCACVCGELLPQNDETTESTFLSSILLLVLANSHFFCVYRCVRVWCASRHQISHVTKWSLFPFENHFHWSLLFVLSVFFSSSFIFNCAPFLYRHFFRFIFILACDLPVWQRRQRIRQMTITNNRKKAVKAEKIEKANKWQTNCSVKIHSIFFSFGRFLFDAEI